jgi:hypothetical protein
LRGGILEAYDYSVWARTPEEIAEAERNAKLPPPRQPIYVPSEITREAVRSGVRLGRTQPSEETKGSWWDVRFYDGKIIACSMWAGGPSAGKDIDERDLHRYVAYPKTARRLLQAARAAAGPDSGPTSKSPPTGR